MADFDPEDGLELGEEESDDDGFDEPLPAAFPEEIADTPNSKLLRIAQVALMAQADSYRANTPKEEIMLAYLRKFEQQFANLHPKRRMPLLAPRNECGMRKFICTTLRPTQLAYQEVYDYDKCAKFVADYIRYEPLELASQLPQHMPSPSATLEWQAGDCFDMAQVLASLLLGVGYDAYVCCSVQSSRPWHCRGEPTWRDERLYARACVYCSSCRSSRASPSSPIRRRLSSCMAQLAARHGRSLRMLRTTRCCCLAAMTGGI